MDPVLNPYSPGAGRPPGALVGRDGQRERWRISLDRVEAGRTAQPVVLYGLRGVGKTVLLTSSSSPLKIATGSSRRSKRAPGSRCANRSGRRCTRRSRTWHDHQRASGC